MSSLTLPCPLEFIVISTEPSFPSPSSPCEDLALEKNPHDGDLADVPSLSSDSALALVVDVIGCSSASSDSPPPRSQSASPRDLGQSSAAL